MENSEYKKALNHIGDISIISGYDQESDCDEYTYVSCSEKYANDMFILDEACKKAAKYDDLMKPKKVHTQSEWDGEGYSDYHHCPKCGCPVTGRHPVFTNDNFCSNCGCPLDWKEEKK